MKKTPNCAAPEALPKGLVASDKYVRELDGIRAIAVSVVVAAHYRLVPFVPGGFGVTLFFFLSGYLITTLFFAEFQRNAKISVSQFYLRRWLRLTPPLLIFVLLATVSFPVSRISVGSTPTPLSEILAAVFYITNYYILFHASDPAIMVPLGISWSLAIEEHFYLIWPWVIRRSIRDAGKLCRLIIALCACVLVWRITARLVYHAPVDYTYMATDCRIDSILYGALLRAILESSYAKTANTLLSSKTCQILAIVTLAGTFVIRDDNFRETIRYSIQGIAVMPIFMAILTGKPTGPIRRLLSSRPMVLVGKLSYSIYLFHLLARTPGEAYFGSPFVLGSVATGLTLTGLIALILYVFVEKPMAGLRHRLRRKAVGGPNVTEEPGLATG